MIVKITVMVANIPPMRIADPRKSASSGAIGKFIDKQNVTKRMSMMDQRFLVH